MKMKKIINLWALCLSIWALTSCTDTGSSLGDFFYQKSEQRQAITCINNAIKYTKKNEKQMLFLTSRGYKWNDLKYGLSRRLTYQGKLMLQIPIIEGRLVSADVSKSLYGQANRAYVLFVFDNAGKITTIDYIEQIPSKDYQHANNGKLYYQDFQGIQDEYDIQGNYLGYYNVRNGLTRMSTEPEDTMSNDSLLIDGGELPGGEVVAPYPPSPDNPSPDLAITDTLNSTYYCEYCNEEMVFDEEDQIYYCPNCGAGGYGGGGGGNTGGGSGTASGNATYKVSTAVAYIKSKAYPYYSEATCGHCARAVREALERGGIDTSNHPLYAKDYGPYLEKWGFSVISSSNYTPQIGDIRVFPALEEGLAGHIDMYGGDTWYSDYKEGRFPGPRYANTHYVIYRKK